MLTIDFGVKFCMLSILYVNESLSIKKNVVKTTSHLPLIARRGVWHEAFGA